MTLAIVLLNLYGFIHTLAQTCGVWLIVVLIGLTACNLLYRIVAEAIAFAIWNSKQ